MNIVYLFILECDCLNNKMYMIEKKYYVSEILNIIWKNLGNFKN